MDVASSLWLDRIITKKLRQTQSIHEDKDDRRTRTLTDGTRRQTHSGGGWGVRGGLK